ncbi:hypothetical protein [Micromonospora zamorensis]|uniref:hypothetical protein n=1 Tax=Micromonospora zamorensis TaxID=709883 RepID=UPI00379AB799
MIVRLDRQGIFTVTGQGHLHLPAAVRHWGGLSDGDWVLLVANPADGLTLLPPWTRWSWNRVVRRR